MTLGPILNVGIGMVFVYFLLSLIASGIQEVVAGAFTWRGTYLRRAIDVLLSNEKGVSFGWTWDELRKAHLTPEAPVLKAADTSLAGLTGTEKDILAKLQAVPNHPILSGAPIKVPSYIPSRNFALVVLETLRDGSNSPMFDQIKSTIATLPDGRLKQTLSLFANAAGEDADAFRKHLEQWFDDAMDRVNGVYARLSQYFLLSVALVMAIGLNVNSVRVAGALWSSPPLAQTIVEQATNAVSPQSQVCAKGGSTVPEKAGAASDAATSAGCNPSAGGGSAINGDITNNLRQMQSLQLPIGWSELPTDVQGWVACVVGWIVTTCAVGLGAPFWFGLLQNLTNFRSAGPEPKRADAKPS